MKKFPSYSNHVSLRATALRRIELWRKAPVAKLERGMNGTDPVFYEESDRYGGSNHFRATYWADQCDVRSINHKGWYTDSECQDGTLRGVVVYLGHGRWLAGYHQTCDTSNVYFMDVHDSQREAAFAADEHARVTAEAECEFHDRFYAAQALQDRCDTLVTRLRELLALRHKACMKHVKAELPRTVEALRQLREELATEYKGVL